MLPTLVFIGTRVAFCSSRRPLSTLITLSLPEPCYPVPAMLMHARGAANSNRIASHGTSEITSLEKTINSSDV